MAWERWIKWGYGFHKFTKHHRKHHCHLWHFASNSQRVSTHAPPADRRVLAVNARGTPRSRGGGGGGGVARGGEMAAENKPEGKREITRYYFSFRSVVGAYLQMMKVRIGMRGGESQ